MTAPATLRRDLALISSLVPRGARVLDLGCGDGELLDMLRREQGAFVRGIELSSAGVAACVARGLSVFQGDLDEGLADFLDGSFDLVVLSQTLQVVRNPMLVAKEMLRVGTRGIISFPNFGYWRTRWSLALRGRMPVNRSIPFSWYDTPNIHHTTLKDFRDFAAAAGAEIEREIALLGAPGESGTEVRVLANLRADTAVFVLRGRGAARGGAPRPRISSSRP